MEHVASSTLNGAHSELQMGLSRLASGAPNTQAIHPHLIPSDLNMKLHRMSVRKDIGSVASKISL